MLSSRLQYVCLNKYRCIYNISAIPSSSSYRDLGKTVQVSYTAGSWTGRLAKDSISIGDSNPVESFLVVIESAEDFYIKNADWVGIMGLAYSNLAKVQLPEIENALMDGSKWHPIEKCMNSCFFEWTIISAIHPKISPDMTF